MQSPRINSVSAHAANVDDVSVVNVEFSHDFYSFSCEHCQACWKASVSESCEVYPHRTRFNLDGNSVRTRRGHISARTPTNNVDVHHAFQVFCFAFKHESSVTHTSVVHQNVQSFVFPSSNIDHRQNVFFLCNVALNGSERSWTFYGQGAFQFLQFLKISSTTNDMNTILHKASGNCGSNANWCSGYNGNFSWPAFHGEFSKAQTNEFMREVRKKQNVHLCTDKPTELDQLSLFCWSALKTQINTLITTLNLATMQRWCTVHTCFQIKQTRQHTHLVHFV